MKALRCLPTDWPRLLASLVALAALGLARPALAADAGATIVDAGAVSTDAGAVTATGGPTDSVTGCVESIPQGQTRPELVDSFPSRGYSGYAQTLAIIVEHGKGETVLPYGLSLQSASEAAKALKDASFVLPDQDGGAAARITTAAAETAKLDRVKTTLELPLVALPSEPGRHVLTVPPMPVAVARANGEIATVCTRPHKIIVEDPTASTPNAKPKANPDPVVQREEWTAMKRATQWLAIGATVGAIVAFALYKWMTRPKPVPPPPPPRPPWEVALERLDEVRHAGLLEVGRFGEYFDRTSDAVRGYLGALYGFDGLESTTDEIVTRLKKARVQGIPVPEVVGFLQECDLVKFANMTPALSDASRVLESGERIVRATMPRAPSFQEPPASPGGGPPVDRPTRVRA